MRYLIAINYVNYQSEYKRRSQDTAISVLVRNKPHNAILTSVNFSNEQVNVPPDFHIVPMLQNDAQKKIGNNRRMPYIKEIMDICSNMPSDVFGYMNSDILLKKDFFDVFKKNIDAYVFYKKDIESLSVDDFIDGKIKVINESPDGVDAFFFSRKWWIANRSFFPSELVLGESEWDTCYNSIIQKVTTNYALNRTLYHINHDRIWTLDSRGAVNNKLIWDDIRNKYGFPQSPETRQL